jgi:hypothetical protein
LAARTHRYSAGVTSEPEPDGREVGAPNHEVEVLQKENEALRHLVDANQPVRHGRGRSIGSWVLIVLACLLAITSVVVVYARNELLNTDTFVATVAPLAKDKAVQTAVAHRVSQNLVARTDVEQRVKNALPSKAGFLANPITSAVSSATYAITLKLVQSSQFQTLWDQALRKSHAQLDNLLLGEKVGALASSNGQVTVDLSQVEATAKQKLSDRGLNVFNNVPAYSGSPYVLFESKQLLKLQRWVKFLNKLALVLPVVTFLMFAAAVVLARDRRRGLVHAASGLAVSMAVLLIGANVGRNQYLASLLPSQSKDATAAVIDTIDATLVDSVRSILIVAFLVAMVAFVLGFGSVRRWINDRDKPAWMTGGPVHATVAAHRKAFQWGVLVFGLLVLVLWNQPTVRVAIAVVAVTLLVVGMVGVFAGRRPHGDRGPTVDSGMGQDKAPSGRAGSD